MAHLSYIRALRTYLDIPIHYRAWAEATKIKWDNINLSTIDDDQVLFYRDGDYRVMVIVDANYFEKSIVRFLGTLLKIVVTFDEHKCKLVMTKGHRLTGTYRTALKECLFPYLLDYIHRMAVLANEQSLIYKVRQGSVYHTEYTNDLEFNLNSLLINSNDAVMQAYLHKLGKWRRQCVYRRLRVDLIELRNDILIGHYQLPTEQTMWQEEDAQQLCQHFLSMHLQLQQLLLDKYQVPVKAKIQTLPVTFEIYYLIPWSDCELAI